MAPSSQDRAPVTSSSSGHHAYENLGTESKLTDPNYTYWSVSFSYLVTSQWKKKHLIEFPPPSTAVSYVDQEANDDLVHIQLAECLSKACQPIIRYDKTMKAAWDHLEELYSMGAKTSQIYVIHCDLALSTQDTTLEAS